VPASSLPRGPDGLVILPELGVTRRKKRLRIGNQFASMADLEAAKKARAVQELMLELPEFIANALLGGELAASQVPCAERRAALLRAAIAHKAGPDGGTLEGAVRAWHAFQEFVLENEVEDGGLPASAALIASFLVDSAEKAQGSAGGTTVANNRRVGLLWLKTNLKFPFDVENPVVLGVANPGQLKQWRRQDPAARKRKTAGSLPIAFYCNFELIAASATDSPLRFFSRSLLAYSLFQSVRGIDALRTRPEPDESEPETVVSGWSYFSKDGEPLRTYAPASGFLGDFAWWPEHQRAVRKLGLAFPAFELPYGSKGSLTHASGAPLQFVLPKAHMVATIRAVAARAPLSLSESEWDSLNITCHSHHGTPSDMLQYINAAGGFGPFSRDDVREIGHWLRLAGLEANAERGPEAPTRHRGATREQHVPGAFDGASGECAARYVEGDNRLGRREAQLDVRRRWVRAVRAALAHSGTAWFSLPRGREDWSIFKASPPKPAAAKVVMATLVRAASAGAGPS
jgi:hypothetical protein